MSAVFISYRRDDSAGHTGRLYDHLYEKLGKDYVFMDIDTIEPGMDFVKAIDKEIKSCSVLIVVIGDEWLTASDENGRRLDDPNDFIHIEIRSALRRDLRIIPVLVKGAKMPAASDLPDDIAALSRRHALELSDSRWNYDIKRLLTTLATSLEKAKDRKEEPANTDEKVQIQDSGKKSKIDQKETVDTKKELNKYNVKQILVPALGIGLIAILLVIFWQFQSVTPDKDRETASTEMDNKAIETITPIPEETELKESPTPEAVKETRVPQVEASKELDIKEIKPSTEPMRTEIPQQSIAEKRIEKLISNAAMDVKAFRLTSPAGNNAVEKYRKILELKPDHPAAVEGIKQVAEKYMDLARSALRKGQIGKAENQLRQAQSLHPKVIGLEDIRKQIAMEKLRINENRQAERAREAKLKAERETQKKGRKKSEPSQQEREKEVRRRNCRNDCKDQYGACAKKRWSECEPEVKAECEDIHQACLNDPQVYILWGEFGTDAECNGRLQHCIDRQTSSCQKKATVKGSACHSTATKCLASCL